MPLMMVLGLAGLILLTVSADQLVAGAAQLAARMGMAPIVVGIVVIGFGTSAPELLVSGTAAHQGRDALAVGNLTGSNVVNLTLILGASGLIAPLAVRSSVLRREAPLAVGGVTVFAVLLLRGLDLVAGVTLSVLLVGALVALIRTSRTCPGDSLADETVEFVNDLGRPSLPWAGVRAILGLTGTLAGAELLVANAAEVAARLGMSQQVIGFTLVAIGTSLPELVTSIQAQRRGEGDLLVGNLLGSNLLNSLAGGAVVAFSSLGTAATGQPVIIVIMVGVGGFAWALMARGGRLSRPEAALLMLVYVLALPLLL